MKPPVYGLLRQSDAAQLLSSLIRDSSHFRTLHPPLETVGYSLSPWRANIKSLSLELRFKTWCKEVNFRCVCKKGKLMTISNSSLGRRLRFVGILVNATLPCPAGTAENSPALEALGGRLTNAMSPAGTAESSFALVSLSNGSIRDGEEGSNF